MTDFSLNTFDPLAMFASSQTVKTAGTKWHQQDCVSPQLCGALSRHIEATRFRFGAARYDARVRGVLGDASFNAASGCGATMALHDATDYALKSGDAGATDAGAAPL